MKKSTITSRTQKNPLFKLGTDNETKNTLTVSYSVSDVKLSHSDLLQDNVNNVIGKISLIPSNNIYTYSNSIISFKKPQQNTSSTDVSKMITFGTPLEFGNKDNYEIVTLQQNPGIEKFISVQGLNGVVFKYLAFNFPENASVITKLLDSSIQKFGEDFAKICQKLCELKDQNLTKVLVEYVQSQLKAYNAMMEQKAAELIAFEESCLNYPDSDSDLSGSSTEYYSDTPHLAR